MTRLRMMRAYGSRSKNDNSGAQLWVWDMVGLRRGRARRNRSHGRNWVKIKAARDGGCPPRRAARGWKV
jgi:hypothetical protein